MKKVLVLSVVALILAASLSAADWNAYRGNDSRTGNDNSQFLDPAGLQHMALVGTASLSRDAASRNLRCRKEATDE